MPSWLLLLAEPVFLIDLLRSRLRALVCRLVRNRTYQLGQGGHICSNCPAGFFCKDAAEPPVACSVGHYCPEKSEMPQPCPPGTYRDAEGAVSVEACFPCPPGRYCSSYGSAKDLEPCPAGYYCPLGAGTTSSPARNIRRAFPEDQYSIEETNAFREDPCSGALPCLYALM